MDSENINLGTFISNWGKHTEANGYMKAYCTYNLIINPFLMFFCKMQLIQA